MAVARRTIRTSENLDEFQDKFMQRIGAMARAHDLLVKNSGSAPIFARSWKRNSLDTSANTRTG